MEPADWGPVSWDCQLPECQCPVRWGRFIFPRRKWSLREVSNLPRATAGMWRSQARTRVWGPESVRWGIPALEQDFPERSDCRCGNKVSAVAGSGGRLASSSGGKREEEEAGVRGQRHLLHTWAPGKRQVTAVLEILSI